MIRKLILSLIFSLVLPISAQAASCFWVGGTATWDGTNTGGGGAGGIKWASASGGGTACAGGGAGGSPAASDNANFDANSGGGTVTVNTNFTVTNLILNQFTGTLDFSANNNSPTIGLGISVTQSSAATWNCGSGTYTMAASNSNLNFITVSGLTLNCTSATFAWTNTVIGARFIGLNGQHIGTVTVAGLSSGIGGGFNINTGGTIDTLTINRPNLLIISSTQTLTITNAFNWVGTSSDPIYVGSNFSSSGTISVASGNPTLDWAAIEGITFSGGATFTATNSTAMRSTGITVTPPGGGGRIIGGWLFKRDLQPDNDNFPAFVNQCA